MSAIRSLEMSSNTQVYYFIIPIANPRVTWQAARLLRGNGMTPKDVDRIFWIFVGTAIAVLLIAGRTLAQEGTQLVPVPPLPAPDLPPTSGWSAPLPSAAGAEWSSSAPTGSAPTTTPETIYQAPPPPPSQAQAPSSAPFIVYVNGDSPYLLQQVRTVAPTASVQMYQGRQVIQTGAFWDESGAQQQVLALRMQGIGAEVIQAGVSAVSSGSAMNPTSAVQTPFLVVIPARPTEYYGLGEQLLKMGFRAEDIIPKDKPLGFHLQVGAFANHQAANAFSQRLRANGLDARVYYQR